MTCSREIREWLEKGCKTLTFKGKWSDTFRSKKKIVKWKLSTLRKVRVLLWSLIIYVYHHIKCSCSISCTYTFFQNYNSYRVFQLISIIPNDPTEDERRRPRNRGECQQGFPPIRYSLGMNFLLKNYTVNEHEIVKLCYRFYIIHQLAWYFKHVLFLPLLFPLDYWVPLYVIAS